MTEISRRNFLKGAGLGAGLGALGLAGASGLAACAPQSGASGSASGAGGAGGASGAGGAKAAWRIAPSPIADADIKSTEDCEVLVLGLGNAGAAAMRAAAEAGAKVYAFHDSSEAALSFRGGGQIGHINSQFLAGRGVPKVDVVEFVNDWQVRSNNRTNPGLIRNYANLCGQGFDWYFAQVMTEEQKKPEVTKIGCWKEGYDGPHMRNYSGVKSWVGTVYVNIQTEAGKNAVKIAQDKGGKVFWETPAVQLLTDSSGAVVGAVGDGPDGYVKVTASKGVIICTGGYGTNKEMAEDILWEVMNNKAEEDNITCMMDSDGKGIAMGVWAGGRLDPCTGTMDGAYWYPTDKPTDALGACAGLWINADGERYCNEGFGSTELMAMPGAKQPEGMIYTVFGSNVDDLLKAQPFGHMTWDFVNGDFAALHSNMDAALAAGADGFTLPGMGGPGGPGGPGGEGAPGGADASASAAAASASAAASGAPDESGGGMAGVMAAMAPSVLYAANDLKTLAGYLGYQGAAAERFVASVEHYNSLCASGVDSDYGKDPALMIPVQGPYYAYGAKKHLGDMMLTVSGLQIDENGAVLGEDWRPIKGLFAAGNASGCRFGWQYFTSIAGESLSIATTLGGATGKHVATGVAVKDLTL